MTFSSSLGDCQSFLTHNRFYVLEKLKSLANCLYTYMIILLRKDDSVGIDYEKWLGVWLLTNNWPR